MLGTPDWSESPIPGIFEGSLPPSVFAHLAPKDQVFYTEKHKAVNINGIGIVYAELLKENAEQPTCINCKTTAESINSWRRPEDKSKWICINCGNAYALPKPSFSLTMRAGCYSERNNGEMPSQSLCRMSKRPAAQGRGPPSTRILYPATQLTFSFLQANQRPPDVQALPETAPAPRKACAACGDSSVPLEEWHKFLFGNDLFCSTCFYEVVVPCTAKLSAMESCTESGSQLMSE